AAAGQGARVRPRGRRRAGADRRGGGRLGPARALRRTHAADEDARRRACATSARPARVASRLMRTRTLGDGGPEVTVVGLGTNNFGNRCDYEQSRAVIDAALGEGITLFDTADIYSQGTSEEYIGRALEGR